ncbi:MAG: aromatic amino acid ammonia-lyase [Bacteroidales bacterium]|nr:aromatic amino acid ammonia-lyase [Bacteroidales bacterium]
MMDFGKVEKIIFGNGKLKITAKERKQIEDSYAFLESFCKDKVIYGINTGFGPMAQYRVSDADRQSLQYNIIRSHSTGAGEPFEPACVKAAMVSRYLTFAKGKSGVHIDALELLAEFINHDVIPFIPQHGSVGASGDLVQLAHMALTLIGEGLVFYRGNLRPTADVLQELHLKPIEPHIREGLALVNGTAMMTGVGLVNLHYARLLLDYAVRASVMVNEIVASYDDFLAPELNHLKNHSGQTRIAQWMTELAESSQRMLKREVEMYHPHKEKVFKHKVQPFYSLRCIPQILGPIMDTLDYTQQVLEEELNAVDDNPIVDITTKTVYHGGNFHGDYVSFEMDKLKIAITKLTMLMERQFNYLCHDKINELLPPFLNLGQLGLNYGVQAMQFTATSTTAECQTLSNPMYVHSIPNNNDNQDVVSMGTNSAILARRVIDNAFQVMAIHYIGLVQAVDCLKIKDELCESSRCIYNEIRELVPVFIDDTPKYEEVASVIEKLKAGK